MYGFHSKSNDDKVTTRKMGCFAAYYNTQSKYKKVW